MKNAGLFFFAFAAFALSGCGSNLKSAKQGSPFQGRTEQAQANEWGASLEEGCVSRSGQYHAKEKLCIYASYEKDLAEGAAGSSDVLTSQDLTTVNPGQAVHATGYAYRQSVQIAVDGEVISPVPSKDNKPVTIGGRGGKLQFQLKPGGEFEKVKVYVYSCVDESLREVRCPY